MKNKPIKIRREWVRHPCTRIKEDKEKVDICEQCGAYRTAPNLCNDCLGEQIGNA